MRAWLRAYDLWDVVSGDFKRPTMPDQITDDYTTQDKLWTKTSQKAAGWIYPCGGIRAEDPSHRY